MRGLRQHPAPLRHPRRVLWPHRLTAEMHLPRIRPELAGQHPHQRRLARSVRPDNRRDLTRLRRETHRPQQTPPADLDINLPRLDAHSPITPRLRSKIQRKTGAPISAVTIPMGNSAGPITTRAITSAHKSSAAPRSAALIKSGP